MSLLHALKIYVLFHSKKGISYFALAVLFALSYYWGVSQGVTEDPLVGHEIKFLKHFLFNKIEQKISDYLLY